MAMGEWISVQSSRELHQRARFRCNLISSTFSISSSQPEKVHGSWPSNDPCPEGGSSDSMTIRTVTFSAPLLMNAVSPRDAAFASVRLPKICD
jgi:hypothetical protein